MAEQAVKESRVGSLKTVGVVDGRDQADTPEQENDHWGYFDNLVVRYLDLARVRRD
ncbi:hypothetical protein PF001_g22276 [Phytophthora fragariae]|uniref:Uncharacterized protein n=1 Tax=Phytophthora fragariae TaxID=53985 RepID=A0A6A4C5C0_9STRA|nr:hypothetical protein PF003_g12618 [Phytophthora fragariae]KAE9284658.1 hypothetical protein PF001_g22276 [Phytophthora fragariae]